MKERVISDRLLMAAALFAVVSLVILCVPYGHELVRSEVTIVAVLLVLMVAAGMGAIWYRRAASKKHGAVLEYEQMAMRRLVAQRYREDGGLSTYGNIARQVGEMLDGVRRVKSQVGSFAPAAAAAIDVFVIFFLENEFRLADNPEVFEGAATAAFFVIISSFMIAAVAPTLYEIFYVSMSWGTHISTLQQFREDVLTLSDMYDGREDIMELFENAQTKAKI